MGITVLIAFFSAIAVVLFQTVLTIIGANPYKKVYHELLLELSQNPKDEELRERTIETGNEYYSRIKSYGMDSYRGVVCSGRMMRLIGPVDEKMLLEDMYTIIKVSTTSK